MNRYRIILASVLIISLLFSCAARTRGIYHIVKENETLTGLARTYDCDISAIARANHMKPTARLKKGSVVFIPGAKKVRDVQPPESVARSAAPSPPRLEERLRETPPSQPREEAPPPKTYAPTFRWPVQGKVSAHFGLQSNGLKNTGINIDAPEGAPVEASESGTVIYAGPIKYFGSTIIMRHHGNFTTVYANLKDILFRDGDIVAGGTHIAAVGRDELSGMPYLHFEIRYKNSARNPLEYLTDAR